MKEICLLASGLWLCVASGSPVVREIPQPLGQEDEVVVRIKRERKDVEVDWILDHADLFGVSREDFEKQFPEGSFDWQDKEKSRARFNPVRNNLKLRSKETGETIVSFKSDKISSVIISVLNKGDDGLIKERPYLQAVKEARELLQGVAKVAEAPRRKNETVSKADGLVWSTRKALYMLEHLWVKEEIRDGYRWYAHAEFVRIRILPPQVLLGVQQNTMKTDISRPTLAKRVKKDGSKVLLEGIPMVDQGSKGYCAVASFERVMRYYGSQVDMHDLADLANTSGGGTSPSGIKEAVHKMAVRSGLRTREPIFMQGKDFMSMLGSYNREARKIQEEEVEEDQLSGLVDLYQKMKPELFKQMRLKDAAGFAKFSNEIARSINAGIPVMWALQLGMFWEEGLEDSYEASRGSGNKDGDDDEEAKKAKRAARPPIHMAGGHMRLIVGYDPAEKTIFYSDSWGPGHELKKMSLGEAWAVTMGLFIVEP